MHITTYLTQHDHRLKKINVVFKMTILKILFRVKIGTKQKCKYVLKLKNIHTYLLLAVAGSEAFKGEKNYDSIAQSGYFSYNLQPEMSLANLPPLFLEIEK
jgi:hypothetical protein